MLQFAAAKWCAYVCGQSVGLAWGGCGWMSSRVVNGCLVPSEPAVTCSPLGLGSIAFSFFLSFFLYYASLLLGLVACPFRCHPSLALSEWHRHGSAWWGVLG